MVRFSGFRKTTIALLSAALASALLAAGCFGESNALAGEESSSQSSESADDSEKPYDFRSYEGKVELLRTIPDQPELKVDDAPPVGSEIERSASEWRERLSSEEFRILREEGTERAGSGEYHDHHGTGIYRCAGCGAPLFSSRDKFDSGTGWPSFTAPYQTGRLGYSKDGVMFSYRVEVHCARCGGHLGHVFNDGPAPSGKRYCINAASLDFEPVESSDR